MILLSARVTPSSRAADIFDVGEDVRTWLHRYQQAGPPG